MAGGRWKSALCAAGHDRCLWFDGGRWMSSDSNRCGCASLDGLGSSLLALRVTIAPGGFCRQISLLLGALRIGLLLVSCLGDMWNRVSKLLGGFLSLWDPRGW